MDNITIYVATVVMMTIVLLYLFFYQDNKHQYELTKIIALEYKYKQKEKELEYLRSLSQKCAIDGLNTPRKCYFGSNYTCSWNETIGRCDMN